jgi:hypothetical protein
MRRFRRVDVRVLGVKHSDGVSRAAATSSWLDRDHSGDGDGGGAALSARLPAPAPFELFACNVVSVARPDLELIREKLRMAFRDLRSIVPASQPEQVAAVINLQRMTFDPERGPAGPPRSPA